jgi:hypothetical protein
MDTCPSRARPDDDTMDNGYDNRSEPDEELAISHLTPEQLTAYLDGGLPAGERTRLDDHLRECLDCRHELIDLRSTVVLLRGLPEYRPRRSFQLTPEQVDATRPWWERFGLRLLPALPALRAATVAAAILLVAVSAGEVIRDRSENSTPNQPAVSGTTAVATTQTTGASAPTALPRPTQEEAVAKQPPETAQSDALRQTQPTPVPTSGAGEAAGAPAPAPTTTEASENEAPAEEPTGGDAAEAEAADDTAQTDAAAAPAAGAAATETAAGDGDGESIAMAAIADEATTTVVITTTASGGGSAAASKASTDQATIPAASPALPTPTATAPTPTAAPATPSPRAEAATPAATPAPVDTDRQPAASDDGVSGWRIAQIGLVVLVLWLAVTVIGLQRLRRRQ